MGLNGLAFGFMFGTIIGGMVQYYNNYPLWSIGIGTISGAIIFYIIDEIMYYSSFTNKEKA